MSHQDGPRDRSATFFAAGLLVFTCCTVLSIFWLPIFRWLLRDPYLVYDSRPGWLHALLESIDFVPWIIGAGLVFLGHFSYHREFYPLPYFAGVLTLPVLAIFSFLIWLVVDQLHSTAQFDSQSWTENAGTDTHWPVRLRMVDDLVANHQLRGRSKADIIELLGPPDDTPYWTDWDLVYWLGPERSFIRIDSEWLVLRLGTNDDIIEYAIVRD